MIEGAKIYKFIFSMNGCVNVSSMAENKEVALSRVKMLFGERNRYEFVSEEYSHTTGNYSIIPKPKERKETAPKKINKEKDLLSKVIDAYAGEEVKVTL